MRWSCSTRPTCFGNPDNYTQANPLVTPPDIVPEWYLLPFYAMLRSIPQKLIGVLVLFGALVTLVFIPWLDTSPVRSCRFRPLLQAVLLALRSSTACCSAISVRRAVDATFPISVLPAGLARALRRPSTTTPSSGSSCRVLGLIETPKPLPATIANRVLGNKAAAE